MYYYFYGGLMAIVCLCIILSIIGCVGEMVLVWARHGEGNNILYANMS